MGHFRDPIQGLFFSLKGKYVYFKHATRSRWEQHVLTHILTFEKSEMFTFIKTRPTLGGFTLSVDFLVLDPPSLAFLSFFGLIYTGDTSHTFSRDLLSR